MEVTTIGAEELYFRIAFNIILVAASIFIIMRGVRILIKRFKAPKPAAKKD